MSINPMSAVPEPLRQQIEEAAKNSPDMNVPNSDDPVDDGPTDGDNQVGH